MGIVREVIIWNFVYINKSWIRFESFNGVKFVRKYVVE